MIDKINMIMIIQIYTVLNEYNHGGQWMNTVLTLDLVEFLMKEMIVYMCLSVM